MVKTRKKNREKKHARHELKRSSFNSSPRPPEHWLKRGKVHLESKLPASDPSKGNMHSPAGPSVGPGVKVNFVLFI